MTACTKQKAEQDDTALRREAQDRADMRAAQLSALLSLTCGDSGAEFRNCIDSVQDNVMWLASTLADELVELLHKNTAQVRP
jgi:hypothetical protein